MVPFFTASCLCQLSWLSLSLAEVCLVLVRITYKLCLHALTEPAPMSALPGESPLPFDVQVK